MSSTSVEAASQTGSAQLYPALKSGSSRKSVGTVEPRRQWLSLMRRAQALHRGRSSQRAWQSSSLRTCARSSSVVQGATGSFPFRTSQPSAASGTSMSPSSTSAKSSAASMASAVHVERSHVAPTSVTQLSYSRPWGHCALACSSSPSGQPLKGIGGSEGYTGGAVAGGHSVESNTAVASDGSSFQDSAKSRWYAPPYGPRQRFLGYVPTPPVELVYTSRKSASGL
mmetsp:Transcript_28246/g.45430  ORF Transcript_28246/g.45430 Transcript_28246/m.45430 type:complete len:226 (+) Transcript_28246:410-1087(+)